MVADGCDEGGVLQVRCKAGSSENIEVQGCRKRLLSGQSRAMLDWVKTPRFVTLPFSITQEKPHVKVKC